MSMSGAFEARTSVAVVPRPARPSGVRASVSPNNVWVMLSMRPAGASFREGEPASLIYLDAKHDHRHRRVRDRTGRAHAGGGLGDGGASLHHGSRHRAPA